MEENNLLTSGVEVLYKIKDNIIELQGYQAKYNTLASEEQKLEKGIQFAEKEEVDEITSTSKKRRQEIEETFDKQIDKIGARIRKIKDKREKRKDKKVSERIGEETAQLREENNRLKLEAKALFSQKHVPAYCNTTLFYALYLPKYLSDILFILGTLLITLFIVPCGIYFFVLPEERILYLILVYIVSVIIFGGIYLLIGNHTKDKHPDELKQVRILRAQVRENKKRIKAIKTNIRKDRDESSYGLEGFDEELTKLNNEEAEIVNQKKEALLMFDNTTSQLIASEIKDRHKDKLTGLKSEYDKVCSEASVSEDYIKALSIKLASDYEPLIGKDLMTIDRLDALINIMKAGNAATVSEAVTFHKQNMG